MGISPLILSCLRQQIKTFPSVSFKKIRILVLWCLYRPAYFPHWTLSQHFHDVHLQQNDTQFQEKNKNTTVKLPYSGTQTLICLYMPTQKRAKKQKEK